MKAVVLKKFGGPDNLDLEDVAKPVATDGEVLVRVRATSVNPVDWKIRSGATKGRIDVALPAILGRDVAGEIEQIGPGVSGFAKSQKVMALANRTYAEFVTIKSDNLTPMPDGLKFEQAAALPLVSITGAQLIERAIKIASGQTVLILGALGSVGRSAAHVALKHGARVIAGVRKDQRKDAHSLGVDEIVAVDGVGEMTKLQGLDAVADTIGGGVGTQALKTLKSGGVFGSVVGPPKEAEQFDVRVETFMARPDADRLFDLAKDAAEGDFIIPVAKTLTLEQIREAHREAEQGGVQGKIVLRVA